MNTFKILNHPIISKVLIYLVSISLFSVVISQKCQFYDINLQPYIYNNANYNSADGLCLYVNQNSNTYCGKTISSCVCKTNFYGENCDKNVTPVNLVNTGVSSGDLLLIILLLCLVFPLILIIGLFIIFFLCKDRIYDSGSDSTKNANIDAIYNKNRRVTSTVGKPERNINMISLNQNTDIGHNVNFKETNMTSDVSNNNANNLFKRDLNVINVTESNITNDNLYGSNNNNKYSQIPLSTERRDDNMLITVRNTTDIEQDISTAAYKPTGLKDLNIRNQADNYDYARQMDEIEEFTMQFKYSLQENFGENENFMNFIDFNFTSIESLMMSREYDKKVAIKKIKLEYDNIFERLNKNITNGAYYLKSNNFQSRYNKIFGADYPSNDTPTVYEEDKNNNNNTNIDRVILNRSNNNFDLSFNNERSDFDKNNLFNLKRQIDDTSGVKDSKVINNNSIMINKSDNIATEDSYIDKDTSKNEILNKNNNPIKKKVFAIKSVQIVKNKLKDMSNSNNNNSFDNSQINNENVEIKGLEISNNFRQDKDKDRNKKEHRRNETAKSGKFPNYENNPNKDK